MVHVTGKDGKNKTNDLQGAGSGITYLKRYTLQSLVGLPSEDDDGKSGQVKTAQQQRQAPPPQQPQVTMFTVANMKKREADIKEKFKADKNLSPAAVAQKLQTAFEESGFTFNPEISAELKSFCGEIYNNLNS